MNLPSICGVQLSELGQKNLASSSSLTKDVPQTGHTEGNIAGCALTALFESSTPVILE